MIRIAIIIGSTRPGRIGEAVAKWVYEISQKRSDAEFELFDIKDFNLPLLDDQCHRLWAGTLSPWSQLLGLLSLLEDS